MHKLFCAKLANCIQPKIVSKSLFPPYRKDRRGRTFCKNAPAFSSNQPTLQNLKYLNPLDPRFPPLLVSSHLCSSSPLRRASASSLWSLPPRSSTSPLAALQLPPLCCAPPREESGGGEASSGGREAGSCGGAPDGGGEDGSDGVVDGSGGGEGGGSRMVGEPVKAEAGGRWRCYRRRQERGEGGVR